MDEEGNEEGNSGFIPGLCGNDGGGGDPASELAQERKGPWDRVVERS